MAQAGRLSFPLGHPPGWALQLPLPMSPAPPSATPSSSLTHGPSGVSLAPLVFWFREPPTLMPSLRVPRKRGTCTRVATERPCPVGAGAQPLPLPCRGRVLASAVGLSLSRRPADKPPLCDPLTARIVLGLITAQTRVF